MIKFISFSLLLTFILESNQVFAEDNCIVSLSSHKDKRIEALSSEAQGMLVISSLIASQLQLETPRQINITIFLLSGLTEVNSQGNKTFLSFSLIDGTLFTILNRLEILEDVQNFLLSRLGFNNNKLGPFSMIDEGGLTLHLNKAPSLSVITDFNYNNTIDLFLDKVNQLKKNKEERISYNRLTFDELLLLVSPLRSFLFRALNTEDRMKIKSVLYELFNNLKSQRDKNSMTNHPQEQQSEPIQAFKSLGVQKRQKIYSKEEREKLIQEAIQLIEEEGISESEVAHRLNVNSRTLWGWLNKYEKEHRPILGRKRESMKSYSQEEKDELIQKALPLIKRGVVIREVASRLNVKGHILWPLISRYEQKHGAIPGRKRYDK